MKERYRVYRRDNGVFYLHDNTTGKQASLRTTDKVEARRLASAHNQAYEQPALNVSIAKAYLKGRSPKLAERKWHDAIHEIAKGYSRNLSTALRWTRFARSEPLSHLRNLPIIETESTDFLAVLNHPKAGSSTNVWLRRLHNFCLDMGWLLNPILPKKLWPKITHQTRYAISQDEHRAIIDSEKNPERRLYYEMLWVTGGSQDDIAKLTRLNVREADNLLAYQRQKLEGREEGLGMARILIGPALKAVLDQLPRSGYLFPHIQREKAGHRSTEFKRRCLIAGVKNRTLHCYRYGWAERACNAGMPEREAMKFLGHKSKAVHRAYAFKADAPILPLESYEQQRLMLLNQRNPTPMPGESWSS